METEAAWFRDGLVRLGMERSPGQRTELLLSNESLGARVTAIKGFGNAPVGHF